jgi:hypothetical protein
MNFMRTFWSRMEKCSPLKFAKKCYKLSHYKIMTFFTITNNVIIIAELDLLTRLACWYGHHMSLLVPNDEFCIKLKLIVNTCYIFQNCLKCLVVALDRSKSEYEPSVAHSTHTLSTHTHTPLFLFSLWWCANMFDPIGVSRQTHGSLFVERNQKQKNNNIYYVFAANRSYTKEEICDTHSFQSSH